MSEAVSSDIRQEANSALMEVDKGMCQLPCPVHVAVDVYPTLPVATAAGWLRVCDRTYIAKEFICCTCRWQHLQKTLSRWHCMAMPSLSCRPAQRRGGGAV